MNASKTLLAFFVVGCVAAAAHGHEVSCRIDESVVQEFAETVFPLKITGKKKVELPILGSKMAGEVSWTAIVSKPRITIDEKDRSFVADVNVKAEGITWDGTVDGVLDIAYDTKKKAIVVQVEEAIVPVSLGPLSFKLDVSEEVPEMPFRFSLPDFHASFDGKDVHVTTTPTIRFEKDTIVLEGDVECRVKD